MKVRFNFGLFTFIPEFRRGISGVLFEASAKSGRCVKTSLVGNGSNRNIFS